MNLPTKTVDFRNWKTPEHLPSLPSHQFRIRILWGVPTSPLGPITCLVSSFDNFAAQVRRFWEVQNVDVGLTVEEQQCEEHFSSTHSPKSDGRYVVLFQVEASLLLCTVFYSSFLHIIMKADMKKCSSIQKTELYSRSRGEVRKVSR